MMGLEKQYTDVRANINERLYTSKLCIEYLGVPNPRPQQIAAWIETWPSENVVSISDRRSARQVLKEQEIPELLYKIGYYHNPDNLLVEKVVRFYRTEDLILFKLMYNKI